MGTTSSLSAIQSSVAKLTIKPTPQPEVDTNIPLEGAGGLLPDGSIQVVADLPNGMSSAPEVVSGLPTPPVFAMPTQPALSQPPASVDGEVATSSQPHIHSATGSSASSSPIKNINSSSASPHDGASLTNLPDKLVDLPDKMVDLPDKPADFIPDKLIDLPDKLADLQNPSTFDIGAEPGKKKFTKASFLEKTTCLQDAISDPADPLSMLDPLWSVKSKDKLADS